MDSGAAGRMTERPDLYVSQTLVAWLWTAYPPQTAWDAVRRLMASAAVMEQLPERYAPSTLRSASMGPIFDPAHPHQRETLARTWPELKRLLFLRYGPIPCVHRMSRA